MKSRRQILLASTTLLAAFSAHAQIVQFSGGAPPSGGGGATPAMFQMVASAPLTPQLSGDTGDAFKIPLPNATKAGNCLLLGITYPNGVTPVVTDNNGNTWGAATKTQVGAGNTSAVFVLLNANTGQTTLTVTFGSRISPFQYTVAEFYNVATSAAAAGSISAATTGTGLATGSFTPTNNNATGGNLIWMYTCSGDSSGPAAPTNWSAGSGFTLLDADISVQTAQGLPHASQYIVQTTSAAINPGFTVTGAGGTDHYNNIAVALKAASAGAGPPTTIYVRKILHFMDQATPSSWPLQTPCEGNLRVFVSFGGTGNTAVTSNDSTTWTRVGTQNIMYYAANKAANLSLVTTFVPTPFAGNPFCVQIYDVANALAAPFDTFGEDLNQNLNGLTSFAHHPDITPAAAGELVIAFSSLGTGPGLSVTAPPGATFQFCTFTGETDNSSMTTANLLGHGISQSSALQSWSWTFTNNINNSSSAAAAAFKSM